MSDLISYVVPIETKKGRADKVLASAHPQFSRVALQKAFDAGLVMRRGGKLSKSDDLKAGDAIEFSLPDVVPSELRAVDIPLDVLYEDSDLLAINKPAGMVVHPGAGTGEDTLVHALLSHCKGGLSGIGGVERPGIVHRLDRETSGVLLVAKHDSAHRGLSEQFANRTLSKQYLALVKGAPDRESGAILKKIARHPTQRHKMTVVSGEGRMAHTDWVVAERFGHDYSLIRCFIHTGRTHQIRVHLRSIKHPIVGDPTYGWTPDESLNVQPGRVMLHAEQITFSHPTSGKRLTVTAPLPADFLKLLCAFRKQFGAKRGLRK